MGSEPPTAEVMIDSRQHRRTEGFVIFGGLIAALIPLVLLAILGLLLEQGWAALVRFGPGFFVSSTWHPLEDRFGAVPFIAGTVASSAIAMAIALPIGIAVGIFLADTGWDRIRTVIGSGVELLSAIPSVVFGLWALYALAPVLYQHFSLPISDRLARVPFLAGPVGRTNLLAASLVLAIMILPTQAALTREVIRAVPRGLKEASLAVGASWWETTWKIVLPAARGGIIGASAIALGRALGEAIAVTMVIGNRPAIPGSIFQPAYSIASLLANEFGDATGIKSSTLLLLGFTLVLVALLVNVSAQLMIRRFAAR